MTRKQLAAWLIWFIFLPISPYCFGHSMSVHASPPLTPEAIYKKIPKEALLPQRLEVISAIFLNSPYFLGAQGEGPEGRYDQSPEDRMDAFDCVTLIDTVLALALSREASEFISCLRSIRYRDAHVDYFYRNHFTDLDWNLNNQKQGILKDITDTIHDIHGHPVAQKAQAWIDKPQWYKRKTQEDIKLLSSNAILTRQRLKELQQKGSLQKAQHVSIPYIPFSALLTADNQANTFILQQIPQGAIIEIIRPGWDLRQSIGTALNVSHLGFAFWKKNTLIFRNASSITHKVSDVPLVNYLVQMRQSPTIKGINIQLVTTKNNASQQAACRYTDSRAS